MHFPNWNQTQDADDADSLVPSPSPPPMDVNEKEGSEDPCPEQMVLQDSAQTVDHQQLAVAAAVAAEEGPIVPAIPVAPEPEIAGPPVEEYPDDTPLEALRPRVAAPEAPAERGPRAAAAYALVWTDVTCNSCHQVCGQFKFSPGPSRHANQDPPTWFMRVKENDTWPSAGPNFRRRLAKIIGDSEEYCKTWIQSNRKCCNA